MNKNSQTHFTTGEFARLCGVSKHTLFHYDLMGIFSPSIKGENGYRYYSMAQFEVFSVISTLKELDMPLKEIKAYMDRRSPEELAALLAHEERLLAEKIGRLQQMKDLIHQKAIITQRALEADTEKIHLCEMPEEYLVLTPMHPLNDNRSLALSMSEHVQYCEAHHVHSPYSISEMIECQKVEANDYEGYSYLYTQVAPRPENLPVYVKNAGLYLVAYHKGGYCNVRETYCKMLAFARGKEILVCGYFFEDVLLDELSAIGHENYILKISILTKDLSAQK